MDIPFDNKDFVDYLRTCSKKARKRVFDQIKENDTNKVHILHQLGSRSVVNLKRLKISNNRNTYHTFKRNTHSDTNHKLKMNILSIHKTSANIKNSEQIKFSTGSIHKTIKNESETKEIEKSYIEETISSSLSDKCTQYSNIKTQNTDSNISNRMNSTSISRKEEKRNSKTLISRNDENNKPTSRLKDDPNKSPASSKKSHMSKNTNVVNELNVDSGNGLQQGRNSVIIRTPSLNESKHSPKSQEQLETTPRKDKLSSVESKNFSKRLDEGVHLCNDKRLLEGDNSEYMRLKIPFETQDANTEHTDTKVEIKSLHQKQEAEEYYFSDISSHDGDDNREETLSNATYCPINILSIAENVSNLPNHEPVENDINIMMDEMLETVDLYLDPKRDTYFLQTEMVESPKPISKIIIQVDDLVSSSVGPKSQDMKTTFSNQQSSSFESKNVPSESTILENNSQIKQSSVSESDNKDSIAEKYNSIVPTNISAVITKRRTSVIFSTHRITSSTTTESNEPIPSTCTPLEQSRDITAHKGFPSKENILSASAVVSPTGNSCVPQSLENNNNTINKDPSKPSFTYDSSKENTTNIETIISSNDLLKPSRETIICETGLPERTLNSTSVTKCEILGNQSNIICDIPNVQNITTESKIIESKPLHSILKNNSAVQENSVVNCDDITINDDNSSSSVTIDAQNGIWLDGIPQSTYVTFAEIIQNSKQLLADKKPIDFVTPLMVATTGWSTPQMIDLPVQDPSQSRVDNSLFKWNFHISNMKNKQKTISPDDDKSDSSKVSNPKEVDNPVTLKWKESINQFNDNSKLYSKNNCLLKRRHSVMESTAPTTSASSSETIGDRKNDNNESCSRPYQVPKRRNSAAVKSSIDIPASNIEESVSDCTTIGHSKKDNDGSYPIKKRRNSTVRESVVNQKNKIEESSPSNYEAIAQLKKGNSEGCSKTYQISKRRESTVKSSVDNQINKVEPSVRNCETSDHLKKGSNNKDNEGSTTYRRQNSNVKQPSIDNPKINIESSIGNCETSVHLKKENNKGNEGCSKLYQVPKRRNSAAVKTTDIKESSVSNCETIGHSKKDINNKDNEGCSKTNQIPKRRHSIVKVDHKNEISSVDNCANTNTDKENSNMSQKPKRRHSVVNHDNKTNESSVDNCDISHFKKGNTNTGKENYSNMSQKPKHRHSVVNHENKTNESTVGNCETIKHFKKGNDNKDNHIPKRRNSVVNKDKIEQSLVGNCETINFKKGNNNKDNEICSKTNQISKRRNSDVKPSIGNNKNKIEQSLVGNSETIDLKKANNNKDKEDCSKTNHISNRRNSTLKSSIGNNKHKIEQSLVGNCETINLNKSKNNKDNEVSKTNPISKRRNSAVKPSIGNKNKIEHSLVGNCETNDLKKRNNNNDNEGCVKTYHIPKRRHSTVEKSLIDIPKTNIEEPSKKKSRHSNESNAGSLIDKQSNIKATLKDKSVDNHKTKIESFKKKSKHSDKQSNLNTSENDKSFSKNVNTPKSNNVPHDGSKSNSRTDLHSIKENKEACAQISTQMSMPLLDDFSDQLSIKPDTVYHKKHIPAILGRKSNIDDTRTRISDDKSTMKRISDQSTRSKQTSTTDKKLNVKINLNQIKLDELFQNEITNIDVSLQVKSVANVNENTIITANEIPIKATANDSNNASNDKNEEITELVKNPEETEDLPHSPNNSTKSDEFAHLPEFHNVRSPNSTNNITENDLQNQKKRKDSTKLQDKSAAIESRIPVDSTTELQYVKSNADILKDSNLRDQIIVKSNSVKNSPKILALDLFNIPHVTSSLRENFIKNCNEPVTLLTLENAAEHIADVFIATMNNCTMLKWLQAQMSKCPKQFAKMVPKLKYVVESIIDFHKRATSIQVETFDMKQFCVMLNNEVNQRLSQSNQLKSHKFQKEMFQVISLVIQYSPLTENKTNLYYLLTENINQISNVLNNISDKNTNTVETAMDLTTSRTNSILEQSTKTTTNSSPVTSSPQIQSVDWSSINQTKSYLPPNKQQKSSNNIIPTCVQRTSFDTYKVKFTEQSVMNIKENTNQILTSTNSFNSEPPNVSALKHCRTSSEIADLNRNTGTTRGNYIPDIQLQNITTGKQNFSPNNFVANEIYQQPTLDTTDESKAPNISTIQNKLNDNVVKPSQSANLIRAKTPTTENPKSYNQNISNLRNILTQGKTCTSNIQQSQILNLPTSNNANPAHTIHHLASNLQEVNKLEPESIHNLSKPTYNSITSNSQNISICDNTANQQNIPVFNTQPRENLQNSINTANNVHGNIALPKITAEHRNNPNSNSQQVNTLGTTSLQNLNKPTHINNMGNGNIVQQIPVLNTLRQNNVHPASSVLQNLPTKQYPYPIQQPLNSYGLPPAYNTMNCNEYFRRLQHNYERYIQKKLGVENPLRKIQEMGRYLDNHLKMSAGNQLEYEHNFEAYKKWWEHMYYSQHYSKIQPHQQQPYQQQHQQQSLQQSLQQQHKLVQYPQHFYQTSATNPPTSANLMASRSSRDHHKPASYYQQTTHISQNVQHVNHTNHQPISSLNIQTATNFRQPQSISTTQQHPISHAIATITSSQEMQNCTTPNSISKSKNITQSSNSAPTFPIEQHYHNTIVKQNLNLTQMQNNSIDHISNVLAPAKNITINQNIYHNNNSTLIQVLPEQNQVILEANQNNIRHGSQQRVVSSIPEYHQISNENIQNRRSHQVSNKTVHNNNKNLIKVIESSLLSKPIDNYQTQDRNVQNNQLNIQENQILNNTRNHCNLISVTDRNSLQSNNIGQILDIAIEEHDLDNQIPANRITLKNSNHKIDQILNNDQNIFTTSISDVVKPVDTNVIQTSSSSIQATSTWIPTTCSVNTYNQTIPNSNLSSAGSNVNPVPTSVFQSNSSSNVTYLTGGTSTVNHIPNEIAGSVSEYIDVGMLRNIRVAGAGSSSSIQQLQGNSRNLPRIESTDSGYTSPADIHPQPQNNCPDQCEMCSEPGNFLCSGCQAVHYCSQHCQLLLKTGRRNLVTKFELQMSLVLLTFLVINKIIITDFLNPIVIFHVTVLRAEAFPTNTI